MACLAAVLTGIGPVAASSTGAHRALRSTSQPVHAIALTDGHAGFDNGISVLAGSASWVVYEQETNSGPMGRYAAPRFLAMGTDHIARQLPLNGFNPMTTLTQFSLVGDMLVDLGDGVSDDGTPIGCPWWNLQTGAHGRTGPSVSVMGASPDGWIGSEGETDATIYDYPADGDAPYVVLPPQTYPTPTAQLYLDEATTGADGFFVFDGSHVKFYPWGSTTGTRLHLPAHMSLTCDVEEFHALGCLGYALSGNDGVYAVRLPTNGDAATETRVIQPAADSVWLTPDRTGWETDSGAFMTAPADPGRPVTTATYDMLPYERRGLGSAFDKFVVARTSAGKTSLAETTSAAAAPTTLASSTPSPIHTSEVCSAGSTVSYVDDEHDEVQGHVVVAELSGRAFIRVTAHRTVYSGPDTATGLACSSSTVAVNLISVTTTDFGLVLHGRSRYKIHNAAIQDVSGARVLYRRDEKEYLLNAASGTTTRVGDSAVGVTDGRLIFTDGESVWSRRITGHKHTLLFRGPKRPRGTVDPNDLKVTDAGGWVAAYYHLPQRQASVEPSLWSTRANGKGPIVKRIYDVFEADPDVHATSQGILITSVSCFDRPDVCDSPYVSKSNLIPWRSKSGTVVLTRHYLGYYAGSGLNDRGLYPDLVDLSGRRVAWIDRTGTAHVGTRAP